MSDLTTRLGNKVYEQTHLAQNLQVGLTSDGKKKDVFDVGALRQRMEEKYIEISNRNPMIMALYKESRTTANQFSLLWFESNNNGRQILNVKI